MMYGVVGSYIGWSKRLQNIHVWWLIWVIIAQVVAVKLECVRGMIICGGKGGFVVAFEPELYEKNKLDKLDWCWTT